METMSRFLPIQNSGFSDLLKVQDFTVTVSLSFFNYLTPVCFFNLALFGSVRADFYFLIHPRSVCLRYTLPVLR